MACLAAATILAASTLSASAAKLTLRDGRPYCEAYACDDILPQAESFQASEATALPIVEALREGKVFAYLFLSTDLVDIPAYSGKPLVTLIAIDPKGIVLAAKVVHHSEPILLVGLPENVLNDYLNQYVGQSILDRFEFVPGGIREISQADSEKTRESPQPGSPVPVHMITSATVTALVLEETLLTSSRQVARALGLVQTAARGKVTWKADYLPKTWQQLVDEGSIGHLRVEAKQMDVNENSGKPWIDLYFGDITPPIVGVNVLGESTYEWLKGNLGKDEKAIFVVANGISSFKGSAFVRGGIFDRFHLKQGLEKFSFKDLDYDNLYKVQAKGAPKFKEAGIFKLRDPRFDSTRPWQFVFLTYRLTGETATSKAFKTFSTSYHLPGKYYDLQELAANGETSLIARIWQRRAVEVGVLAFFLATVMGVFFLRRTVTVSPARLEWVHNSALIASVVIVGLWLKTPPSVTQLFPFIRGIDEGIRFGLFLSDPLLFVFWSFIAVGLLLWGRGWFCGWICPYGSLLELVGKLSRRILPKKMLYEFPQKVHDVLRRLRYVILFFLVGMAVYSLEWAERLAEIEPFKTTWILGVFERDWYLGLYWWALLAASIFNFRFFCRYLCPLGAALSIGSAMRTIGIHRKEYCRKCKICARGCDSRAIDKQGQINKYECLYCMECYEKYYDDQICPPLIIARRHGEKLASQRYIPPFPIVIEQRANAAGVPTGVGKN